MSRLHITRGAEEILGTFALVNTGFTPDDWEALRKEFTSTERVFFLMGFIREEGFVPPTGGQASEMIRWIATGK